MLARQKHNSAREPGTYYAPISSQVERKCGLTCLCAVLSDPLKDDRRIRRRKKSAFSKNWSWATSRLKREVSEPGTESMKLPWIVPPCKCVLMCKVGHLFGAGTAVVCLSGAMSESFRKQTYCWIWSTAWGIYMYRYFVYKPSPNPNIPEGKEGGCWRWKWLWSVQRQHQ